MEYIFLVVAAAWAIQFVFAYLQLRQFHRRLAALRRYGRASVGMDGNRWRGRTYAVVAIDAEGLIRRAEVLSGYTVFAALRPVPALEGQPLSALRAEAAPPGLRAAQWRALQHAAGFLEARPAPAAALAGQQ